jgi:hypothetical protein
MPIVVNLTGSVAPEPRKNLWIAHELKRTQLKDNSFDVANLATFSLTL